MRMVAVMFPFILTLGTAAVTHGSSPEPTCRPIEGVERLLASGSVVLVGELHGTVESPGFVRQLACSALSLARPVVIGLEIPTGESDRMERFLASPGDPPAVADLLAGRFWQGPVHDGRSSHAMVELLEQVRLWRSQGRHISAIALDPGGGERDRGMADRIREARDRSPGALVLALTGNIHNRVSPGTTREPAFEPMGYLLVQSGVPVVSLNFRSAGGSAWNCAPECGPHTLGPADSGAAVPTLVRLFDTPIAGYHGEYVVGPFTASKPALEAE